MAEAKKSTSPPSSNTTPETEVRNQNDDQNEDQPRPFSRMPLEMVEEVFKHLDVPEIQRNRQVCWQFNMASQVSRFTGGDLVVKPYDTYEYAETTGYHQNHRWYHTDEYADPTAFVPRLPEIAHLQRWGMFEKLRRLRIAEQFKISMLSKLACPNLSHLDIHILTFDLNESMTLQLSQLEVLHIRAANCKRRVKNRLTFDFDGIRLTFDSMKLSALCLGEFRLSLVTFDH